MALNPATVVRSTNEQSPFHHWAPNEFDVGGNTNRKNDIMLDGAPSMTAQKSSYTPPMDAVQEVNLQQNAVDAEFGHSAGGVISVQMKSGTNDFHGTAYYLGRNPALNALADRITRGKNLTRQHVWGVTQGNPIMRNKLFNFFSYEGWRTIEPRSVLYTMPTELERNGDFSRSLNRDGGLRTIYDPYYHADQRQRRHARSRFPDNIIPANRIDPDCQEDHAATCGSQTARAPVHRREQLPVRLCEPIQVLEHLRSRRLEHQRQVEGLRPLQPVQDVHQVGRLHRRLRWRSRSMDRSGIRSAISGDAVYTLNPTTVLNFRGRL